MFENSKAHLRQAGSIVAKFQSDCLQTLVGVDYDDPREGTMIYEKLECYAEARYHVWGIAPIVLFRFLLYFRASRGSTFRMYIRLTAACLSCPVRPLMASPFFTIVQIITFLVVIIWVIKGINGINGILLLQNSADDIYSGPLGSLA